MNTIGTQLQAAEKRLINQHKEYTEAGIPIEFSPKALLVTLEGFEERLIGAARAIERAALEVTHQPHVETPFTPGLPGSRALIVPTMHFDFEEAESSLIKLLSEVIANREHVAVSGFTFHDMFMGQDTVRPLNIPRKWQVCSIPGIPIAGFDRNPLLDPKQTGFSISSSHRGTQITNRNDRAVDPRLTRVKIYKLLRDIVDGTKPMRQRLVDIQFS